MSVALKIGLSLNDLDNISLGMLLDILRAAAGEDITETDERYNKLKAIENLVEEKYAKGEICKKKYDNFKAALCEYESG